MCHFFLLMSPHLVTSTLCLKVINETHGKGESLYVWQAKNRQEIKLLKIIKQENMNVSY